MGRRWAIAGAWWPVRGRGGNGAGRRISIHRRHAGDGQAHTESHAPDQDCIVARGGKPTIRLAAQSTVLHAKARGHSRMPEAFYEMVEALCPGSKVELFARSCRKGWASHGDEVGRGVAAWSRLTQDRLAGTPSIVRII